MGVSDYVQAVKRRWAIVLVAALVGALLGAAYGVTREEEYTSTSQLFVAIADQSGNDPLQAGQAAQQRLVSYASLATGQAVTQGVIDQLNLDASTGDVAGRITVQYPPGTVLLNISTTGDSAAQARELNGAVDDQLQAVVRRLESVPGGGTPGASLSVVDPPSEGTAAGRSPVLMILVGLVAGLVVGTAIAFLRDRARRTIDTAADLHRATGVAVVGPIDPEHSVDTGARLLRTKLLAVMRNENASRTVLLTGLGVDAAGVAHSVAGAMANAGQRVIVVDARPDTGSANGVRTPGLAEILRGTANVGECLQDQGDGRLQLAAGDLSGTAVDLLASTAFLALLEELENSVDVVLVHAGDLANSPEIVSIASRPVTAVIVVPLGAVGTKTLAAHASDLIAAAPRTIAVAVGRRTPPDSLHDRLSHGKPSGVTGARRRGPGVGQYPIIAAPDTDRLDNGTSNRIDPRETTPPGGGRSERHRR
jgi:capsular polysaccharide biosynthesis protein